MQFNGNFSAEEKDLIYRWISEACSANNLDQSNIIPRTITISFNTRKKRVLAVAYSYSKRIEISSFFWLRATPIQKEETIKHEACHIIAYFIYGQQAMGHGKFFKECMRNCGLTPEARISGPEYSNILFKGWTQKRYAATCPCGACYQVSGRVRAKILNNHVYRCTSCNGLIDLV